MSFERPDRPVERVFLHCSASDNPNHDDVTVMRRWHTDPKPDGRGWSDVGYHFFIKKDGTVQEGRPLERTPAAQAGHNTGSIAICLHGLAAENFTEAQMRSVIALCTEIDEAYEGQVTFHGHTEVSSKSCPVFPYRDVLGLDRHGNRERRPTPTPPVGPSVEDAFEPIRLMDRGPRVTELQERLNGHGENLATDGIFGQATRAAVIRFQTRKKLRVDGIVGSETWRALTG